MGNSRKSAEFDPGVTLVSDRAEHGCVYDDEYPKGSRYLAWINGDLDHEAWEAPSDVDVASRASPSGG